MDVHWLGAGAGETRQVRDRDFWGTAVPDRGNGIPTLSLARPRQQGSTHARPLDEAAPWPLTGTEYPAPRYSHRGVAPDPGGAAGASSPRGRVSNGRQSRLAGGASGAPAGGDAEPGVGRRRVLRPVRGLGGRVSEPSAVLRVLPRAGASLARSGRCRRRHGV